MVGAVLLLPSGTTAPTSAATAAKPDTRRAGLESRLYQCGDGAVLPLLAMGDTTAENRRYYRLWLSTPSSAKQKNYSKEVGGEVLDTAAYIYTPSKSVV